MTDSVDRIFAGAKTPLHDLETVWVDAVWDEELHRRIDDVERGILPLAPARQAFSQVLQALQT